jgi:hypothetical protein
MLPQFEAELRTANDALRGVVISRRTFKEGFPILRALYIAVVARTIGYRGAIAGWERRFHEWERAADDWWPVVDEDEPEAFVLYDADVASQPAAVRDLWPTFKVLTVPKDGLLELVETFATALELRTDGRVIAKLQPVPKVDAEAIQYFDFVLASASNLRNRSVLFSLYEPGDGGLVAVEWGEVEVVLADKNDLEKFLAEVATSSETRTRIERMLLVASLEGA